MQMQQPQVDLQLKFGCLCLRVVYSYLAVFIQLIGHTLALP